MWSQDELGEIRKECERLNISFADIAKDLKMSKQNVANRFKNPNGENDEIIEMAIAKIAEKKKAKKKFIKIVRS